MCTVKQASYFLACLLVRLCCNGISTVPVRLPPVSFYRTGINNVPDGKLPVCPMPLSHQDLEAIQGDVIPHPLFRPMRLTIT